MIDFVLACAWLEKKIGEKPVANIAIDIVHNDQQSKPVSVVRAQGSTVAGQFSLWATGEADSEIYKSSNVVSQEWGMIVDNETLPKAFERFLVALQSHI